MGRKNIHIDVQEKESIQSLQMMQYENRGTYVPGLVSIIAPCYNEEENIRPFMEAVVEVELYSYRYEVIIVNDGSSDRSGENLKEIQDEHPTLRVLHFPRNFGQQQALMAGIRAARGEVLVTLDMDLQQPPSLIPEMIQRYELGYQVVHGIPRYQKDSASWSKKLTSKLYYKWMWWMGSEGVVYKSSEFRLFSHPIAEVLRNLPERTLYIRGILAWLCPLISLEENDDNDSDLWAATTISFHHQPRKHGKTKYTWTKLIMLAFDGLTATSIRSLRFGLFLGLVSIGLAMSLSLWALYMHLIAGETVSGWTSRIIVVLFFSSMQFILLGLVGEYIGKIFLQVRGRPGYIPLEDYEVNNHSSKSNALRDKKANNKPFRKKANTSKGRILESKVPLESRHPP